jgi:hypothetical protein
VVPTRTEGLDYHDENGKRRKKTGYTDKRESERLAARLEDRAIKIKNGDIDPSSERYVIAERKLLVEHITEWQADLTNRGGTDKHADLSADRVRRLVAVMIGAKPDEVDGKSRRRPAGEGSSLVAKTPPGSC